jgi:hypothetical protein
MVRCITAMAFVLLSCAARAADNPLPRLQDPTLSKTQIVFE